MQVCLRNAPSLSRPVTYRARAIYPPLHFEARRHASFNPLNWVKEKLSPTVKERQSKDEIEAARRRAAEEGNASVFQVQKKSRVPSVVDGAPAAKKISDIPSTQTHKYSTALKMSHRKLNKLGRQISGKPIDYAILQMQFSEKRASSRIMNMLATAKDHAHRYKRLKQQKLVVAEAWVTKGPKRSKKLEPRGRGHYGIRERSSARLHVVLKEGKTLEQKKADERRRKLNRIVSASIVREDVPIRNPSPTWGW